MPIFAIYSVSSLRGDQNCENNNNNPSTLGSAFVLVLFPGGLWVQGYSGLSPAPLPPAAIT